MRIAAIILLLFMLYLAVQPCADALTVSALDVEQVATDHSAQEHSHGHDPADDCTPLCSCHCCHIHLMSVDSHAALNGPDENHYSDRYLENLSQEVTRPILQPPRV